MVDAAIQHQQPNLQRRADSDNTAARQEECEGDDSDGCEKPAGAASTLPIVLGSLYVFSAKSKCMSANPGVQHPRISHRRCVGLVAPSSHE